MSIYIIFALGRAMSWLEKYNLRPRHEGLIGYSVKEIAAALDLSEARIYQLIARAKTIGREYRQNKQG